MKLKNGYYWVKRIPDKDILFEYRWEIALCQWQGNEFSFLYSSYNYEQKQWFPARFFEIGDRIFVPLKYQPILGQL
jgi:hypothetical protein